MLRIDGGRVSTNCAGVSRRSVLRAGFLGTAGLTLGDLYRLRGAAAAAGKPKKNTACILVWLDGGPSQLETYDPKPEAPEEVRGPWGAIETTIPGYRMSETMSCQAKVAHKMAFIRSVYHGTGDHFKAGHKMLTGRWGSDAANIPSMYPSVGSYVARVRGANNRELPPYVGLPAAHAIYVYPGYMGAAYMGAEYDPFQADWDNRYVGSADTRKTGTPAMFKATAETARLAKRQSLLHHLDTLRRDVDRDGSIAGLDHYSQQAMGLLLSSGVREAFDLDAEPEKLSERYGKSPWARYTLLARRLVERGVTFVTVDMPHWDMHSSLKTSHERSGKVMDQAVAALVSDLDERGMLDHVLVVVMGEFGRTPKMNTTGVPGSDPVPGRDHWGDAISVAIAGGGLRMGQVIGATNRHAEHPVEEPHTPEDILATIYHVLGIDPRQEFLDRQARPIPILSEGEPIKALI
jgi:hypothetical protein